MERSSVCGVLKKKSCASSHSPLTHTPRRNPHTLHPKSAYSCFGCVVVSQTKLPQATSPKVAALAQQHGQIQLVGRNLAQASIENTLKDSAMSDISTTGDRSILSYGEGARSRRPDPNTLLFGAVGHEYILLNIEVNELSRTNRKTLRMAQDELSAMEQSIRLAVREHQRLARDAVGQAVLDSSGRLKQH